MQESINAVLSQISDPHLGSNLLDAKLVVAVSTDGDTATVALRYPYPAQSAFTQTAAEIKTKLAAAGFSRAEVSMELRIFPHIVQGGVERLPQVKNIIVVGSAKGGVGKSTTAVNLALALAAEGAQVGILDADVHGPSLPTMLGINERPQGGEKGGIEPLRVQGLQVMSIGFMVPAEQPTIWRGPMASRAFTQLMQETRWDNLDYLVVDLPPGTGDIQLTIAQKTPVTGAVVVTTPQEIAVADAQKGIAMFGKVSIPVLGVVENMGLHRCPHCGHESHIFGAGGARRLCEKFGVPLLGELPLDLEIRAAIDAGRPTVAAAPHSDMARRYRQMAAQVGAAIAQKPRDRSSAFPKIVATQ